MGPNEQFMLWVLAVICGSLIVVGVAGAIGFIRVYKTNPGEGTKTIGNLTQNAGLLQIITAVIVVVAATTLAITGNLTSEASTLLSGIAGFVLGDARSSRRSQPQPDAHNALGPKE
jgi:heme/copper-type cytochrome/quinol oxidase subunit 2